MKHSLFITLCVALTQLHCGGDGGTTGSHIGNPANVTFTVPQALTATPTKPKAQDAQGSDFTIERARVFIRRVELDLPDGQRCEDIDPSVLVGATCQAPETAQDNAKIKLQGPFVIDLLTATSSPSLDEIIVPALDYKRIDYRVDDGDEEGGLSPGDELIDRSFIVDASFDYKGQPTTLKLRLNFNEDLRLEREQASAATASGRVVVELDAAKWLQGASITSCLDDGELERVDGVVIIDDKLDRCDEIEDQIKANIKEMSRLLTSTR